MQELSRRSVSIAKTRGWCLGGHMDHPVDSTAKLCQGGKDHYVGREGIPMDDSSGNECEPVIVFKSLDLSVCQ